MLAYDGFKGSYCIGTRGEMAKANALIHAFHAIDGRHEGPNGSRHRIGVDAGAPRRLSFFIGQAEVGNARESESPSRSCSL